MSHERKGTSKAGFWMWDEIENELAYVSRDSISHQKPGALTNTTSQTSQAMPQAIQQPLQRSFGFKETVGIVSQLEFRKLYQRKVKLTEPDVVTIQDIKDVVLFTCEVSNLTTEFISYFHTQAIDRFLRSLIIYFQYYFQTWNFVQARRKEAKRKLRQPIVTVLENYIRDDLADMRSMVARDYSVILMGIGDAKKFHHMNNKNNESFSDRDRRLFELLMVMATRVIWIALCRKYLALIEKELNRLLRTNIFSPYQHSVFKKSTFDTTPEEDRILIGRAFRQERKLKHRSPGVQELIFDNHDYRMLAIGICAIEQTDDRYNYLEAAYSAPEEELEKIHVPVGILGIPRKYFDAMLKPRELSTTRRISIMKPIPEFTVPPLLNYNINSGALPKIPSTYKESLSTKIARKKQCKMWRNHVESKGLNRVPEMSINISHLL